MTRMMFIESPTNPFRINTLAELRSALENQARAEFSGDAEQLKHDGRAPRSLAKIGSDIVRFWRDELMVDHPRAVSTEMRRYVTVKEARAAVDRVFISTWE